MDYLRTIKYLSFSKLWSAQILSLVASYLLNFSLIVLVYGLTQNTHFGTLSVSLVVLSFTVPAIFTSSVAGAFVDYWNRKTTLVVTNLLRTILVLLYIPASGNLWLILILTFIISTITQFFIPAEAATIPKLVPKRYLIAANSLFVLSIYATFILGYVAVGPTIIAFGSNGPYLITSVMFFISTLLVISLPTQATEKKTEKRPAVRLLHQLKANWDVVRVVESRRFAFVQIGLTQGLIYIMITLAPAMSMVLFGLKLEQATRELILPIGIGMVLGIIITGILPKLVNRARIIQLCIFCAGLSLILLGVLADLPRAHTTSTFNTLNIVPFVVASISVVFGAANAIIATLAQTMLQETTDDANRGKVFGSLQTLINVGATIPIFTTGLLVSILSVSKVLDILGGLLIIYTIYNFRRYRFALV